MSYKPSLNVRNVKTTCQRNDQDLTEIRQKEFQTYTKSFTGSYLCDRLC